MSTEFQTFFGGICTIMGVLIGRWVEKRSNVQRDKLNNRFVAGLRLREAFATELAQIQHGNQATVDVVLKEAFTNHQSAINEFRFFLNIDEHTPFNEAWKEYYADKDGKLFLEKYSFDNLGYFDSYNQNEEAIKRIEAILAFTKDTGGHKKNWLCFINQVNSIWQARTRRCS